MKEDNLAIKNKINLALENQKKNNLNIAEKLYNLLLTQQICMSSDIWSLNEMGYSEYKQTWISLLRICKLIVNIKARMCFCIVLNGIRGPI